MDSEIDNKIARLKRLERKELIEEWSHLYKLVPPAKISRPLLVRSIAHRYQENAYGGLSVETFKALDKLVRAYRQNPDTAFRHKTKFKTGTRLIREWKGELHEVTTTENGFFYRGKEYNSVSEVARTITGTRWSGVAFFGLGRKGNKPAKVEAA